MRALALSIIALLVVAMSARAQPKAASDRDGDGIPDSRDKCPDDPEDKDGFQDDDGCPDPDNDGDGIPDARDKCPNDPEDKDGFQDADGCPDPDNDGDGILDARDKCPMEPETRNGYQDDDGCPDELPSAATSGMLVVNTTPVSQVMVDGNPQGRTPAQLRLKVGPHRLTLLDADKNLRESFEVSITGGETLRVVKDYTSKQVATPPPPPPPPTPPKQDTPPPPPAAPKVSAPTGYRCGPGGKFTAGTPCTCAADRVERRDGDGVSVCAKKR